jgi:hypothetical protein
MELHGLTNEEIVFIYKINQKSIDTYNLIVEKQGIYEELEIPEMGYISVFKKMNDEDIEIMMESEHYKMCLQIENKLAPIVDMIEETLPDVYNKVEDIFKKLSEE